MKFSALRAGLALAILCSIPALAQAQQQFGLPGEYVVQNSTPPNGTVIDVSYVVSPTLPPAFGALVTQAAAVWNSAGANIRLVDSTTLGAPPPTIHMNDFSIPVVFPGGSQPFTSGGPTPSITPVLGNYPDGTPYHQIIDITTSVNINGTVPWVFASGTQTLTQYDLLAFLIREFGHDLGLAYVNDPTSVMNGIAGFQPGPAATVLSPSDIAALQTLYGAPEPATWALFGVGLAALGAAKKSRRRVSPAA